MLSTGRLVLSLPAEEGLRLWLLSPRPLPELCVPAGTELGRRHPEVLAVANAYVDHSVRTLATAVGEYVAIPEYARSLLRGWAGQWLVPPDWATTYRRPIGRCGWTRPSAAAG